MQEFENSGYVTYENYEVYQNHPMPNTNRQQSRNSEICFAFGIVSLCMILGNQIIGLVFGILSLVFHKKAFKEGFNNKNMKDGRVMGLIGTIINSIIVGFYILYFIFIIFFMIFGMVM